MNCLCLIFYKDKRNILNHYFYFTNTFPIFVILRSCVVIIIVVMFTRCKYREKNRKFQIIRRKTTFRAQLTGFPKDLSEGWGSVQILPIEKPFFLRLIVILHYLFALRENRLHLRKAQIHLVFRSVCTIFAAE